MNTPVIHVTDDTFPAEVLRAKQPVLVDYWAEWCGPCRAIAPLLDQVATEYADRLKVVKLNIDDNPQSAAQYGIRSIPTLMLFKNGQVEATSMGSLAKSQLSTFLDKHL